LCFIVWRVDDVSSDDDKPVDELNGHEDIDSSDDDTETVCRKQDSPMME